MIRRGPTRLELKLDDIQEFEYAQKTERRKAALQCNSTEDAKKLIRQERIGYSGPSGAHGRQHSAATATTGTGTGTTSSASAGGSST